MLEDMKEIMMIKNEEFEILCEYSYVILKWKITLNTKIKVQINF